MKQILIILGLFASVTTFAQSPRIKLNQITKDTVKGSVLISSPTDSGMVYSRDFYIAYGADTVLILYGDTLGGVGGGFASVLSDGVTVTGDGTTGNELKVDTSLIATLTALTDSLATVPTKTTPDSVTITGDGSVANPLKVDTFLISTIQGLVDTLTARGYLTANETITLSGDVTGSGTTAITATVVDDSHNHIISNVDFLQDSLTAKANASELSNYVTLDGTETITGAKTFTSDLNVDAKIALNDGGNSVFIGDDAGRVDDNVTNNNVAIGYQALYYNTTGYQNTAIGSRALYSNTTTNNNTANGHQALYNNTSGFQNTANGSGALYSNTTGNNNIANGYQALYNNTTGINNVAIGSGALYSNTTGNNNIANGYQALYNNTTGSNNVANGSGALSSNTTGNNNIANGYQALYNNTTGINNVAIGYRALYSLSTGSNNQAYGYEAGRFLSNGTTALDTANASLFIGSGTRASTNGNSSEIVIGTSAIGNGSNTITIGSSSAVSLHTRNYEFDIDQTVSASEDNYVLTYDSLDGQISLEPISLSGSATLDFGSTSSLNSSDLTITVTGAADGDVVSLGVPNASVNANTNYTAWVSAANTVTVRFNNYSSGAVDPASGTFKVKVFK